MSLVATRRNKKIIVLEYGHNNFRGNFMFVFVIKNIRLKKSLTIYQLSKMTNIARTYLVELENNMEKLIVEEICKNLKWYERIVVKIYKRMFYRAYRIGMRDCFNFYNK